MVHTDRFEGIPLTMFRLHRGVDIVWKVVVLFDTVMVINLQTQAIKAIVVNKGVDGSVIQVLLHAAREWGGSSIKNGHCVVRVLTPTVKWWL